MNYLFSFQKVMNHPNNKNAKINVLGRLFLWKLNQLFFHKSIIINLTPEMKCKCYPDSSFGSLIIYTKLPEYEEMNFIYDFLKKDDTFIDVGANIGAHTLMAASKIKTGKIFSFEPSLKALKYLKENVQINNLESLITVIDKVVSNKNGYEKFIIGKHSEVDHIGGQNSMLYETNMISSITLDKYLKTQKISYIDLIKIDVEGAELKVLEGLKDFIAGGKVGLIIFEINSNCRSYGYTRDDMFKFLNLNDFLIYTLNNHNMLSKLTARDINSPHTFNAVAVYKSKIAQHRIGKYLKK